MDTKLALRLDEQLIAQAKLYAAGQGRSVSDLVASFFARIAKFPMASPPLRGGRVAASQVHSTRRSSFRGLAKGADAAPLKQAGTLKRKRA